MIWIQESRPSRVNARFVDGPLSALHTALTIKS